jgi:hypothetical protein
MRKTIYVCNECGEEIHGNVGRIIPGIFDKNEELNPEDEKFPENDDVHFCVRCLRTVMDRITHAQGTHEDTEETTGAGAEEEPKEEKPVRRRKLDGGKIMALHRAGWSDEKIADEMHATEKQIYKCIYYHQRKQIENREESNEQV